jgi:hypothetical protein
MTNDLTTNDDADITALAGAADNIATNEFVGIPLKFKKGKWLKALEKKKDIEVGGGETFAIDMKSYACGWIKWENGKPAHKFINRPIDGWLMPVRERLPDQDADRWPAFGGKPQDPWQEVHQFVVKCLHEMTDDSGVILSDLLTWTTVSYYGRKEVKRLLKAYAKGAKENPGKMPVVLLKCKIETSPTYGDIEAPLFDIVDWQEFGEGASPPGERTLHKATHLAALRAAAVGDEMGQGDLLDVTPIKPAKQKMLARQSADMDDEIPF